MDSDPGGPKTYGSGSATLLFAVIRYVSLSPEIQDPHDISIDVQILLLISDCELSKKKPLIHFQHCLQRTHCPIIRNSYELAFHFWFIFGLLLVIQMMRICDHQCCGSGMFIPDPDFYPSRIPDPNTAMKDRGEKKFVFIPFFWAIKFTKLNCFIFEMLKNKNWANYQRIIELFTPKIGTKLTKIWIWDPGSGKNLFRIPGSKRHRIHCCQMVEFWAAGLKNGPVKILAA